MRTSPKCRGGLRFKRTQGSVYLTDNEDPANLVMALNALKALPACGFGAGYPGVPGGTVVGLYGVYGGGRLT